MYDVHDVIEVGIVLAEGQERYFEGYSLVGQPGDVWLCAMWEPHGSRLTRGGAEFLIIAFLPAFLGDEIIGDVHWLKLFSVPPNKRPRVTTPDMRRRVLAIAAEVKEDIEPVQAGWPGLMRSYLIRLLTVLYRGWEWSEEMRSASPTKPSEVGRIMPAIERRACPARTAAQRRRGGALCNLSNSHFQRLFIHAMGMSFLRFSLRARLASVANRLLQEEASVEDLAREAGFVDASHLHRHFVKHYGITPGQYRKRRE